VTFQRICTLLAARRCYDAGQSVSDIATSAKRCPATVRRWLKATDACFKLKGERGEQ
jgi:hypothetical protein